MTVNLKIKLDPRVELKIKRTLDGNLLILDHEDIDIVFMPEKNKCVTFPKKTMSDKVYATQDRMFKFLSRKGIVNESTIRGGNVFGALEAEILESSIPGIDRDQVFLYVIYEYIKEEKPYFRQHGEYQDDVLDSLLEPGEEDSTELGDVPQADTKGGMQARMRPYGYMYNYSLVREENEREGE